MKCKRCNRAIDKGGEYCKWCATAVLVGLDKPIQFGYRLLIVRGVDYEEKYAVCVDIDKYDSDIDVIESCDFINVRQLTARESAIQRFYSRRRCYE